ncbi:hypothetical protein KUL25_12760 [Rhodobacteraceae bacterium N5(2021)]|uniref:Uncharacterized protein n=1 Tax=Gymnodinialimonas phycosphaerae TaxID=2841589 RepID=A0A975TT67_9RHOB|nr:hypothetical protein [Gymnodinialimonas phycosphaerae]MBY4893634.1 hypothetical protein [Gymnodinialimonas phycosphaerae]
MTELTRRLVERIAALEDQLEAEFETRRQRFSYRVEQGRVVFERDILNQHKAVKQKLGSYLANARPMVVLTAPVIYAMIIPFVVLDLFLTVYQAICFPVYRIEKVRRGDYITYDRRHLSYLNGLEKLNCLYCAYGNGLLAYAVEIAGRTERRWCPIKHAKRMAGVHRHYPDFVDYGDAEGYQQQKKIIREATK